MAAARDLHELEKGARALPADATPERRACAEALWRVADASEPCRCSGPCDHGQRCPDGECVGRWVHLDRYPGALMDITLWADDYACDGCGESVSPVGVTLPSVPWGRYVEGAITTFPGTRHSNYVDTHDIPAEYVSEGDDR